MQHIRFLSLLLLANTAVADQPYVNSIEPGGLITGEIELGNIKCFAVFDTGLSRTMISSELAERLDLNSLGEGQLLTPQGGVPVSKVSALPISLGNIQTKAVDFFAVHNTKSISAVAGINVGILIGMDILKDYCLEIDYNTNKATIGKFSDFKAKTLNYSNRKLTETRGAAAIEIPPYKFPVLFDTGSDGGFGLGSKAFDAISADKSSKVFKPYTMMFTGAGLSKSRKVWYKNFKADETTALTVQIDEIDFKDGESEDDALIGADVIQNWNWVLDFPSATAYYTASKHFGKPVLPDASGLGLIRLGDEIIVGREPLPESPAGKAKIQLRDILLEIDEVSTSKMSITQIRRTFCDFTGVTKKLVFSRSGETKQISLVLQSPLDSK